MGINHRARAVSRSGKLLLAFICTTSASVFASSSAFDTCEQQDILAPSATLALRSASEDKTGNFVGLFEFRNIDLAPSVEIPGESIGHMYSVHKPHALIQFKDLNGSWTTLSAGPVEEYLPPTGNVRVRAQSKVTLKVILFPKKLVQYEGSEFRILINLAIADKCLASLPFRAVRERRAIQGFVPVTANLAK